MKRTSLTFQRDVTAHGCMLEAWLIAGRAIYAMTLSTCTGSVRTAYFCSKISRCQQKMIANKKKLYAYDNLALVPCDSHHCR